MLLPDCYWQASWFELAETQPFGAVIDGTEYDQRACYLNGLRAAAQSSSLFECAEQLEPPCCVRARAWLCLGAHHFGSGSTVEVGGDTYTPDACFVMALRADAELPLAWWFLGKSGLGPYSIGQRHYTAAQCRAKVFETDPEFTVGVNTRCFATADRTLWPSETTRSNEQPFVHDPSITVRGPLYVQRAAE